MRAGTGPYLLLVDTGLGHHVVAAYHLDDDVPALGLRLDVAGPDDRAEHALAGKAVDLGERPAWSVS
jgi:hypothetical protein